MLQADIQTDREGVLGLRATIESAPVGIAHFAPDGRFLLTNERLCRILGYTSEELLRRNFQDITHPDDLAACITLTTELAMGATESYQHVKRFLRADGTQVWTRVTVSAVRNADRTVAFCIGIAEDITGEKTVEQARIRAEERLNAALESSLTGTFRWDLRTNDVECDQHLERLFGLDRAETGQVLKNFLDVIHQEDIGRVIAACERCVVQGADFDEEYRAIRKDGAVRWIHARGRTFRDAATRPSYVTGACIDITERRQMEAEIRARDEQFRILANAIPQLAWIADSTGNRSWYNDRWYDYTGLAPDDALGMGWQRIHDPQRSSVTIALQLAAFARGEVWEDTVALRDRDGNYRWFLSRAVPVKDVAGNITRWFGTNTDITQQREAESILRESAQRFRRALDIETVGVVFFNIAGEITGANDAFLRMCGFRPGEVTAEAMNWDALGSAEWMPRSLMAMDEFKRTGRTAPFEKQYVRRDGTSRWALCAATRISETEGVEYILDITERKEVEAERERLLRLEHEARTAAEHATRLRDEVLAVVAHDLRNPVQTIVMSAGSILDFALAEDQQQRQLQIIRRSAWRMERLIQDLLDVSRMEAGTFAVARERVDVVDLLSEIIESFDGQAISKNITLTCQPEPRIPPLHGDRDRLVQVMANLIGNALKFTPSGGNVAVRARAADLQVQISVEDNGPGIAPTNLGNVFERFWQADRAAGGAGLGLVIVKGIVEAHGGRISVESTLGKGTTFQVKLPLALHERRRA